MCNESEIIKGILNNFPKSSLHKNEFFHSDSEIIRLAEKDYLISVDSYSDEDHLRINDAFVLGANLAVCTLSDIFACGGNPILFCNSLSSPASWSAEYICSLSKGIASILERCNTGFIGGDFGYCEKWNFTGIVIGEAKRIVTRKGALPGDLIYVTGEIGRGNFEAAYAFSKVNPDFIEFFAKHMITFPLRQKEATLISRYATSCIDTSDGLFKSLQIVSEINNAGFQISDIPYFSPGIEFTKMVGLPKECMMFGECGEYELLFTINPSAEVSLLKDADKSGCKLFQLGKITEEFSKVLIKDDTKIFLNDFDIYARNYSDHYQYLSSLTRYLFIKMGK